MTSGPIVVLGSMNRDLVVRTEQLPRPGETVLGDAFGMHHGGKGLNQAVAAARAGARVSMLGGVGDDEHGGALTAFLGREGVDCGGVSVHPGVPSGVALITVDAQGENCIVVAPGANGRTTAERVDRSRDTLASAKLVLSQLEVPIESVERASEIAQEHGVPFWLNAAPAPTRPDRNLDRILGRCELLLVNEHEAAALLGLAQGLEAGHGVEDIEAFDGLRRIRTLGVSGIVMTRGSRGALASVGSQEFEVRAPSVSVQDTTGCGDAFVGALAAARVHGLDWQVAVQRACAAGACAATVPGAATSLPRASEIDHLLRKPSNPLDPCDPPA